MSPDPIGAATSVDNWCSKCGYLTSPDQNRVQVRDGTRLRYDHEGDCPEVVAREQTRAARYAR
jgi:hypothetical protein